MTRTALLAATTPSAIGSKVLVRIFERRLEIRDLQTKALLRTHAKAERPGTVVLPNDERVFNPSRETRAILKQADDIGLDAARLCQLQFAIEGRVGQRKRWGIVHLGLTAIRARSSMRPAPKRLMTACTATATSRPSPSGWWPTHCAA